MWTTRLAESARLHYDESPRATAHGLHAVPPPAPPAVATAVEQRVRDPHRGVPEPIGGLAAARADRVRAGGRAVRDQHGELAGDRPPGGAVRRPRRSGEQLGAGPRGNAESGRGP